VQHRSNTTSSRAWMCNVLKIMKKL
jgi:hypothetical protein